MTTTLSLGKQSQSLFCWNLAKDGHTWQGYKLSDSHNNFSEDHLHCQYIKTCISCAKKSVEGKKVLQQDFQDTKSELWCLNIWNKPRCLSCLFLNEFCTWPLFWQGPMNFTWQFFQVFIHYSWVLVRRRADFHYWFSWSTDDVQTVNVDKAAAILFLCKSLVFP